MVLVIPMMKKRTPRQPIAAARPHRALIVTGADFPMTIASAWIKAKVRMKSSPPIRRF
jgi:hypothetical protein